MVGTYLYCVSKSAICRQCNCDASPTDTHSLVVATPMVPLEPKDRTSRSSIVIIIITERSENAPSNHSNSPHRISLLRKAGTHGAHGHRRRKQAEPSCRSAAQGMRRFRLPSELPNRQFLCSNVPINLIFKYSYTIWKL